MYSGLPKNPLLENGIHDTFVNVSCFWSWKYEITAQLEKPGSWSWYVQVGSITIPITGSIWLTDRTSDDDLQQRVQVPRDQTIEPISKWCCGKLFYFDFKGSHLNSCFDSLVQDVYILGGIHPSGSKCNDSLLVYCITMIGALTQHQKYGYLGRWTKTKAHSPWRGSRVLSHVRLSRRHGSSSKMILSGTPRHLMQLESRTNSQFRHSRTTPCR